MRRLAAALLAWPLLASSLGCETPSGGSLSLPPVPTPEAERQMDLVDQMRDPISGALVFPDLRAWHGDVADYFCEVLETHGIECTDPAASE